jgi:GNAT superfamily N-acetyltransferase
MIAPCYEIRPLTRAELDIVFRWSAFEGWNPGRHDGGAFYAADPQGFLGGFLDGELIGSISAVAYDESFGFIGLYIVLPKFRGQGYGLRLFKAAEARLGERVAALDGVIARQADYARSGFRTAYRHLRYGGVAAAHPPAPADATPLSEIPFEMLASYDRAAFPAPRRAFLETWIRSPGAVALGMIDAGRLTGYGVARPAHTGFRIGPLFADDASVAERLFLALQSRLEPGVELFLDLPEANAAALNMAREGGMNLVFEAARMYKGAAPRLPLERIFGVTTLELG